MATLGLTAPSSRQDVISALLNDYASFSPSKTSPYSFTNSPLSKDLPPPPPSKDEKPLPMGMMRFQLRGKRHSLAQISTMLRACERRGAVLDVLLNVDLGAFESSHTRRYTRSKLLQTVLSSTPETEPLHCLVQLHINSSLSPFS